MESVVASTPSLGSTEDVADAQSWAHTTKSPAATVLVNAIEVATVAVMCAYGADGLAERSRLHSETDARLLHRAASATCAVT
jgi:hypothetical protein